MLMHGSLLTRINLSSLSALHGLQWHPDNNLGQSDNVSPTAISNDSSLGKHTTQLYPAQGYCYCSSQQPLLGNPQFYNDYPFNMSHSSQPSASATQGFPSIGPVWQGDDLHLGSYAGSQIFPPLQLFRTWAVLSRGTKSITSTAGKHYSHSANIFQLYSSTRTCLQRTWTSFQCTWWAPSISEEKESLHYLDAEPCKTASRWTPALGEGGCRVFYIVQELPTIGKFWYNCMMSGAVYEAVLEGMCKWYSEGRMKARQANKWEGTVLELHTDRMVRNKLPQMPNTMFTVVICWVLNGNDIVLFPKQTSRFIRRCQPCTAVDWFCQTILMPTTAVHSNNDVQVQLGGE